MRLDIHVHHIDRQFVQHVENFANRVNAAIEALQKQGVTMGKALDDITAAVAGAVTAMKDAADKIKAAVDSDDSEALEGLATQLTDAAAALETVVTPPAVAEAT